MNIIELANITFRYEKDELPVFDNDNFFVQKGECVAIEGENGSGKTTMLRVLNGLSFLEKGKYLFNGQIVDEDYLKDNKNSKLFHKQIGYLFQNPDVMLFNATVYDEIAFGPRQMGLTDKETDARVKDLLKLLDIESLTNKAPYHLSGGQKKKVALAAVLSLNPEVLILDEPFAGLDQRSQDLLFELLIELKKAGKTMIIATHNKQIGDKLADRVITLS